MLEARDLGDSKKFPPTQRINKKKKKKELSSLGNFQPGSGAVYAQQLGMYVYSNGGVHAQQWVMIMYLYYTQLKEVLL